MEDASSDSGADTPPQPVETLRPVADAVDTEGGDELWAIVNAQMAGIDAATEKDQTDLSDFELRRCPPESSESEGPLPPVSSSPASSLDQSGYVKPSDAPVASSAIWASMSSPPRAVRTVHLSPLELPPPAPCQPPSPPSPPRVAVPSRFHHSAACLVPSTPHVSMPPQVHHPVACHPVACLVPSTPHVSMPPQVHHPVACHPVACSAPSTPHVSVPSQFHRPAAQPSQFYPSVSTPPSYVNRDVQMENRQFQMNVSAAISSPSVAHGFSAPFFRPMQHPSASIYPGPAPIHHIADVVDGKHWAVQKITTSGASLPIPKDRIRLTVRSLRLCDRWHRLLT